MGTPSPLPDSRLEIRRFLPKWRLDSSDLA